MIHFILNKKTKYPLNVQMALDVVLTKVECLHTGNISTEISEALTQMRFDERFTHTRIYNGLINGARVVYHFCNFKTGIEVNLFKQSWITSLKYRINAYTTLSSRAINFNTRNIEYVSQKEIEETTWHETIHIMDFLSNEEEFHHGENNLDGKEETAPVKLAKFLANTTLIREGETWKLI